MTKLYELSSAYKTIADLIESDDGNDWTAALETLQDSIEDKAANIAGLIRNLEADVDAYEAEAKRLADKAKASRNNVNRLKDYLKSNLEACGLDKLKAGLFTVAIQANPPSCRVLDEAAVPAEFKQIMTTVKIDARGIIEAVKNGAEVPGVEISRGSHLRVY